MQLRTTAILLGLALVGALAAGIPFFFSGSDSKGDYAFEDSRGTKPDTIDTVEIERTSPDPTKLVFTRSGKSWRSQSPSAARLSGPEVDQLVTQTLNARKSVKEEHSYDLARHKLDKPPLTVTLKSGATTVGTLKLGGIEALGTDARVYVASSDRPNRAVPVLTSSLSGLLSADREDAKTAADLLRPVVEFRSKALIAEGVAHPEMTVQSLAVQQGKGDKPNEKVAFVRGSDGVWRFKTPDNFGDVETEGTADRPAGGLPGTAEATGLKGLLEKLTQALTVADTKDFVEGKSPADAGLTPDNPELLRIEIVRKPGTADPEDAKGSITEALLIGKKVDEKGEKLFAKREDEPNIVQVSAKAVDAFKQVLADPSKLRSRDLVTTSAEKIDGVTVKSPEATVTLRKTPTGWRLFPEPTKPDISESANSLTINELLAVLTRKGAIVGYAKPGETDAATGLDKPGTEVNLWAETEPGKGGDAGKPRTDPPTVKLLFGKPVQDVVNVRKESAGTKTDVLVKINPILTSVNRPELNYLDPVLPSFDPDKAVKVVLAPQTGEATEIEKVSDIAWTLKAPASRAGRTVPLAQATDLLRKVAAIAATPKFRKVDGEFLKRNGLEPPKFKVTVTTKDGDKSTDHAYLFGNEEGDQVYGKQLERDMIYTVAKSAVDEIKSPQLNDPTIFPSLEFAKIKGVRMTGWVNPETGAAFTMDLERKGPSDYTPRDWKAPWTVDGAKVDAFVRSLVSLKADKFLSNTGEVKPEYGLPPAADALTIEITQEGRAEPFTLTLGADQGGRFVATAKQLPNDVFLLPPGKPERDIKTSARLKFGKP